MPPTPNLADAVRLLAEGLGRANDCAGRALAILDSLSAPQSGEAKTPPAPEAQPPTPPAGAEGKTAGQVAYDKYWELDGKDDDIRWESVAAAVLAHREQQR